VVIPLASAHNPLTDELLAASASAAIAPVQPFTAMQQAEPMQLHYLRADAPGAGSRLGSGSSDRHASASGMHVYDDALPEDEWFNAQRSVQQEGWPASLQLQQRQQQQPQPQGSHPSSSSRPQAQQAHRDAAPVPLSPHVARGATLPPPQPHQPAQQPQPTQHALQLPLLHAQAQVTSARGVQQQQLQGRHSVGSFKRPTSGKDSQSGSPPGSPGRSTGIASSAQPLPDAEFDSVDLIPFSTTRSIHSGSGRQQRPGSSGAFSSSIVPCSFSRVSDGAARRAGTGASGGGGSGISSGSGPAVHLNSPPARAQSVSQLFYIQVCCAKLLHQWHVHHPAWFVL
jgi:hypothetical protein